MTKDALKMIKEHLRSFHFETAFPLILEAVEELLEIYGSSDTEGLNGFMQMISEAMENKDVIRLCDITEYILYPQLINS